MAGDGPDLPTGCSRELLTVMARAVGRPPIGPQHTLRLSQEDWDWLDRMAAANGWDRSRQVREIIRVLRVAVEALDR